MAEYLLSMHTVEGESRPDMSEEQMQEMMQKIAQLEEEMTSKDALVASARLGSADTSTVVRVEGGETLITDGPFAEAKEHLGGFYIVNAEDIDEALSWATKTTACIGRPIEVRPFAGFRGPDA
jgi:hypothetical protein